LLLCYFSNEHKKNRSESIGAVFILQSVVP